MTNKIGSSGINNRPVQVGSDRSVQRAKNSATSTSSNAAAQSTAQSNGVNITDSAKQLAALENAIRALPEVNQGRVDQIRASIADGSYKVAPERIADKLLRIEGELQ